MKPFAVAALAALALASATGHAQERTDDARLEQALDRDMAVRVAIERTPAIRAGAQRALAMKDMAKAEAKLPPPEISFDVWQVPFANPVSFSDSQMIAAGLHQSFPAIGSLSAREDGTAKLADVEDAMAKDRARDVTRDVDHALIDIEESAAMEDSHHSHKALADQIEQVAAARQAGGGSLSDVTSARVEVTTFEVETTSQTAATARARMRLNALLRRPLDAALGSATLPQPMTASSSATDLATAALMGRSELRALEARDQSQAAFARAADQEAAWPTFSLGVFYFAPTTVMPNHGYGLSASMSLPWLYRGAARRADAQKELAQASAIDVDDAKLRVSIDVATALGAVKAAEAKLIVLKLRALPVARQALDASLASYRSGQGDLLSLLRAERAVVDAEQDVIEARAALEHALVDLDWAVGARVSRVPVAALVGGTP